MAYRAEGERGFVSCGRSGVGSTRRSIAVETVTGSTSSTPDNGNLTHVEEMIGIRSHPHH